MKETKAMRDERKLYKELKRIDKKIQKREKRTKKNEAAYKTGGKLSLKRSKPVHISIPSQSVGNQVVAVSASGRKVRSDKGKPRKPRGMYSRPARPRGLDLRTAAQQGRRPGYDCFGEKIMGDARKLVNQKRQKGRPCGSVSHAGRGRLVKGSQEAKDYMAYLRSLRKGGGYHK